ncbi:deoxyribodipyrimidine photo-lyase [Psychromonas sp. MME2]|uniref:deoxyribodipyrimidine photo-lyase n=1 Tax=unclassified Psychromonas TaxID=2614957 RepID=UPI00339C598D
MQLIWFRKDLRVSDNPALYEACLHGQTRAIYFVTPKQWQKHQVAPIQVDFIGKTLQSLRTQLASLGIPLHIEYVDYFSGIAERLGALCKQWEISQIHANAEPEIDEINRDRHLQAIGFPLLLHQGDTILPAGSVLTQQGSMFKVFSAFRKQWLKQVKQIDLRPCPMPIKQGHVVNMADGADKIIINIAPNQLDSRLWPASEQYAQQLLTTFFEQSVDQYGALRDFPAQPATSSLSPYFALGVLSAKQCLYQLLMHFPYALDRAESGAFVWLNEIIWREFYRHIMVLNPELGKGANYNPLANNIVWQNDSVLFTKWCDGETGYPLVDAAMRQLKQRGWMHNRLRMVTASFLTKHLLIDWRWGESYFKSQLIDGDFASNNGGWQWAASTGCDAQPYFRIFNPILQSQKFDPNGEFIRNYLPELKKLTNREIHLPINAIVDHTQARIKALQTFSVLKSQG